MRAVIGVGWHTRRAGVGRSHGLRATVLSIALLSTALGLGAVPVIASDRSSCDPSDHASPIAIYLCAKPDDLIDVRLGDLHPTQSVLGYYEVYYKLGRYQFGKDAINKRFDDWCEANGQEKAATVSVDARLDNPASFTCTVAIGSETADTIAPMKTGVIGRGGRLFLVDGHHTFTSFLESPDGGPNMHVRIRVLGNLSTMGPAAFWRTMEANHWVWLRDEGNEPITVDQLPDHLGLASFDNDPYRGLVYFTRDIAYQQNEDNANYQEFYWGAWLRTHPGGFDLAGYDATSFATYLQAVADSGHLMAALADSATVYAPFTAGDLGRIDYKASEITKLGKPYCDAKPGKVAYAFRYLGLATC